MANCYIAKNVAKMKQEMVGEIRGAMQRSWEEVVKLYSENPISHITKISRSGYTALHVAVADGNEEIVEKLVNQIVKVEQEKSTNGIQILEKNDIWLEPVEDDGFVIVEKGEKFVEMYSKPLEIKNEVGNTALHLAALIGNIPMCRAITKPYSDQAASLIEIENNMGETPLILASLHGKKDTFLYLNSILKKTRSETAITCCRRHNGDTVLHCAIDGEFFGIYVEKLKINLEASLRSTCSMNGEQEELIKYPSNYTTLVRIFAYLWKFLKIVTTFRISYEEENDTNNPNIGGDKANSKDNPENKDLENPTDTRNQENKSVAVPNIVPQNYIVFYKFLNLLHRSLLAFTGLGRAWVIDIRKVKEKHTWSIQALNELLRQNNFYDFEDAGQMPYFDDLHDKNNYEELNFAFDQAENNGKDRNDDDDKKSSEVIKKRKSAIIIAARNGITEMVKRILKKFPMAIYDTNEDEKNVVLLALENKQVKLYKFLLQKYSKNESIFRRVDKDGNGALHIAASNTDQQNMQRWPIPGDALQMQWEIKWNKFVKNSMPENFCVGHNNNGETPEAIFTRDHKKLVETGSEWMRKTAESCSLVAALIATVAFATSTSLPGGTSDQNGKPLMATEPAFHVFAVSSLIALCFSVTSLVMFLAILTSRFSEKDFDKVLPWKLLMGLTSLFLAIVSMLVSFCAGHFFVLQDALKVAAFPVYTVTFIPISFFAVAQFPLYIDLVRATFWSPFGDPRKLFAPSEY
ncbi:hypothetical protein G4B88_031398 [Cannabis sativa]|uniref:PGG domain-containing protein n=1 Tax=Cannabis sativa TaxID=3483 RepID=A0A7J6F870_CANSA|nr:hypothetical protein G4B88_031398 [Cannabis sativa]